MAKRPATPPEPVTYHERILLAYVRGYLADYLSQHPEEEPLTVERALKLSQERGLRVNKFLKKARLPRIAMAVARILALNPKTVIDVGCGRGTALWPMIDQFPEMRFTGTDAYEGRAHDLKLLRDQGINQIVDGLTLGAEDLKGVATRGYDVALCLEVLEHLPDDRSVAAAAKELLRVAPEVIVSVPSVKDWNPDHKRLFTDGLLKNLFLRAGARSVTIDSVPKHWIAFITAK